MEYSLQTMTPKEIMPGFSGRMVHGQKMSLVFWEVTAGAEVPSHHHEHEQIMHVLEGRFEFTLDGQTGTYGPGDLVLIPSGVPHSGKALTDCRLLDAFAPVREEYR
ncbi:cupin domain-containing protein [Robiginitalea sp. SC105]|uniref:cupin domain-containing protein n=1 Tax=Robiginitalea sp. SC105 TaxID=2762332 RepID=UPI001639EB64|nr:cupin domain-containing protein [Robiginitalea sp. SC105]MBC2839599.1 cupin domain-containing protein [Robiginitalea sp. SC105]